MTSLEARMELMDLHGLRMDVSLMFGKEGCLPSSNSRRVRGRHRKGRCRGGNGGRTDASRAQAAREARAAMAVAEFGSKQKALKAVADRHGVSVTAIRDWMNCLS